jgi:hypothetical protein
MPRICGLHHSCSGPAASSSDNQAETPPWATLAQWGWRAMRDDPPVEVGVAYLEIALRLRKLAPWLVEDYLGPSDLVAAVDAAPPESPVELAEHVRAVRQTLDGAGLDDNRRTWLDAQLAALDTVLTVLAGERVGYRELVERCHGVLPTFVPESVFAAAHAQLAEVLPGRGDVRARYQRWAVGQEVQPEQLLAGLHDLSEELRRRTDELVGLPEGEKVTFELVRDQPWAGYAEYLGDLHTHVRINTDLPITSTFLLELVSHEAYPGHHTESVCKDAPLFRNGHVELGVYLYPTPQSLLSEGIAEVALEALLGQRVDEIAVERLRHLGIPYDADVAAVVRQAEKSLMPITANIAMLLDDGRTFEEVSAYARRWMIHSDAWVSDTLSDLISRRWPPLESCYPEGLAICRNYVAGDPMRFARLLHEQLTTIDLLTPPAGDTSTPTPCTSAPKP